MKITAPKDKTINGIITIPASKSISNRVLIIDALCKEKVAFKNLSNSDDTRILQKALTKIEQNKTAVLTIDTGMAGTSFRFLTAYLSIQKGQFILTGSSRLKERPIKPLVDILLELGADISYLEKEGFAPLFIKGNKLQGKDVIIDASISSQFTTALMLIAPKVANGLNIKLKGIIASRPYLKMTQSLMQYFGVEISFNEQTFTIKEQAYSNNPILIEADWSSASYFYESLALAENGTLTLKNYSKNSIQGDSKIADLYEQLGVQTEYLNNDIVLTKSDYDSTSVFKYDFINEPDLVQAVVCTCVALNIKAELTGLESLKIKETDRIQALKNEISKLNWNLIETTKGAYSIAPIKHAKPIKELHFRTYNDHRMAMCLAPLSLKNYSVSIENAEVVSKSNVDFWTLLEKIGFKTK
jgi:3-phosphoshikimate 1-carboxyvinyltransferase